MTAIAITAVLHRTSSRPRPERGTRSPRAGKRASRSRQIRIAEFLRRIGIGRSSSIAHLSPVTLQNSQVPSELVECNLSPRLVPSGWNASEQFSSPIRTLRATSLPLALRQSFLPGLMLACLTSFELRWFRASLHDNDKNTSFAHEILGH